MGGRGKRGAASSVAASARAAAKQSANKFRKNNKTKDAAPNDPEAAKPSTGRSSSGVCICKACDGHSQDRDGGESQRVECRPPFLLLCYLFIVVWRCVFYVVGHFSIQAVGHGCNPYSSVVYGKHTKQCADSYPNSRASKDTSPLGVYLPKGSRVLVIARGSGVGEWMSAMFGMLAMRHRGIWVATLAECLYAEMPITRCHVGRIVEL